MLKYRPVPTAMRDEDFVKQIQSLPEPNKLKELTRQIEPLAIADGQQAMKVVRQHAAEWGIAPDRIGMMGF